MICKKCRNTVKTKVLPIIKELLPHAEKAVDVAKAVRTLVESNEVKTLTSVMPGEWDEKLRLTVVETLNRILGNQRGQNVWLTVASAITKAIFAFETGKTEKYERNVFDAAAQVAYTIQKLEYNGALLSR